MLRNGLSYESCPPRASQAEDAAQLTKQSLRKSGPTQFLVAQPRKPTRRDWDWLGTHHCTEVLRKRVGMVIATAGISSSLVKRSWIHWRPKTLSFLDLIGTSRYSMYISLLLLQISIIDQLCHNLTPLPVFHKGSQRSSRRNSQGPSAEALRAAQEEAGDGRGVRWCSKMLSWLGISNILGVGEASSTVSSIAIR